jgi:hypothetical protein
VYTTTNMSADTKRITENVVVDRVPRMHVYHVIEVKHGLEEWIEGDVCVCSIPWVNGKKHGIEKGGDPDFYHYTMSWVDGVQHGVQENWYKDKLDDRCYWVNGKKHGPEESWGSRGIRSRLVQWENGEQHGISGWWGEDGTCISLSHFAKGKLVFVEVEKCQRVDRLIV